MLPRLCAATLCDLPAAVARPGYDRGRLGTGIVHLGVGAFHRAHMAAYTDAALEAGDARWGTLGASLRSPAARDALAPQDGLYALAARDGAGERLRVVGSLTRLLVAPEGPEALLAAMAAPEVRIVSLTVTEKGYCHRPAAGDLDEDHPDLRRDLAAPHVPRSAPGLLVEALRRRRAAGLPFFAALSCDNLSGNGAVLKRVLVRFAGLRDPDLGRAVADGLRCPSTVVDRIVPATAGVDREAISAALGLRDAAPVSTEPFTRWVIEDDFPLGRPDWDRAGARFVPDVAPFERAKLRMLNGAHSTLAYLGLLAGHGTVAEAVAAPGFAALLRGLMLEEAAPTLPPAPGFAPAAYADDLLARFSNPALRHRLDQIAADGSQKLPPRLLDTARDRLRAGGEVGRIALGVAAWMLNAAGRDARGRPVEVQDPLAAELRRRTGGAAEAGPLAAALFGLAAVFGDDLPAEPRFTGAVERALARLLRDGAAATVARFDAAPGRA